MESMESCLEATTYRSPCVVISRTKIFINGFCGAAPEIDGVRKELHCAGDGGLGSIAVGAIRCARPLYVYNRASA